MKKIIVKCIAFVLIFAVLFAGATKVFTAKFLDNNSQSYIAGEMYELDDDSVEVVISGSSQAVFCVSSMELYEKYGISSYGTGSPNQPILCSLGWLKEMNDRHNIKVAVLDISQLYEEQSESFFRQTLDTMKLSKNKYEIVKQHVEERKNADSMLSYLIPLIKYHTRWNQLTRDDFTFSLDDSPVFMGHRLGDYVYSFDSFDQLIEREEEFEEKPEMVDYQKKALIQYVDYCKENGIEVVLIKTPKKDWGNIKEAETQQLAEELGVPYISYATKEGCEQIGIDFYSDFKDQSHLNVRGADKLSDALGEYLKQNYDLEDRRQTNPLSDEYLEKYHAAHDRAYFETNGDVASYLTELGENYLSTGEYELVAQLTDDSICGSWSDEMQAAIEKCGITTDVASLGGTAYVASVVAGEAAEQTSDQPILEYMGSFSTGSAFLATSTPNGNSTALPTITKNGEKMELPEKGLNLYLYSTVTREVVDTPTVTVCADGQLRLIRPHEDRHQ